MGADAASLSSLAACRADPSPDVINRALAVIGPKVEEFAPGGLGGLKNLAGKFLNG